ncbi:MAG: hypothetical protein II923_01475 [Campylobacter sp.]|nr:hypothetical protein [Campylobacter sp.]MBQ3674259.1 hypothetical protein [Campylobacter sp.]MBR4141462.1 hypothetical protein [Campylobacter sp.]
MNKTISEKIKSLPKFDDEIVEILEAFDKFDDEKICKKLSYKKFDEKILKIANNKFIKTKFSNLNEAFEFYGKDEIKAFFLFCIFCEILPTGLKSYKISSEHFIEISLMRNLIMHEWIKSYPNAPKIILSIVILMEFGRIFIDELLQKNKKEYEFLSLVKTCVYPQDFTDVEQEFTSADRESVISKIFLHLGLDEMAYLARFSSLIDDADFDIKIPCAMIKVVKTVVNIYHRVDETSIDHTLNLLVEFGFEQEAFLNSVKKIAQ